MLVRNWLFLCHKEQLSPKHEIWKYLCYFFYQRLPPDLKVGERSHPFPASAAAASSKFYFEIVTKRPIKVI